MNELPAAVHKVIDTDSVLRNAGAADLARLLDLLALMHEDEHGDDPSTRMQEILSRILLDPQRLILVAERGVKLVGTLDLFIMDNLTRGGSPWAGVENIVVDPEFRRRGVARSMLDLAIALSEQVGCYKVQLISHGRRIAAHRLYESAGFDAPVRGFRRYL